MKKLTALALLVCSVTMNYAQQTLPLTENTPVMHNGMEYSFTITNERNKSVKGEDYDRFEIEVYVTNKNACNQLIALKFDSEGKVETDAPKLAEFNVKNATGKRLTSKSIRVEAVRITQTVKVDHVTIPGNAEGIVQATLGYGIKAGESIKRRMIVIVPKGERPEVLCNAIYNNFMY